MIVLLTLFLLFMLGYLFYIIIATLFEAICYPFPLNILLFLGVLWFYWFLFKKICGGANK